MGDLPRRDARGGQGGRGDAGVQKPQLHYRKQGLQRNGTIQNVWANCQVNFTQNFWVPAPDHTCWEWYGYKDVRNYPQGPVLTPEQGPCPRIPGSGDDDNGRRLSSDEPEPEVSTCSL